MDANYGRDETCNKGSSNGWYLPNFGVILKAGLDWRDLQQQMGAWLRGKGRPGRRWSIYTVRGSMRRR